MELNRIKLDAPGKGFPISMTDRIGAFIFRASEVNE